MNPRTISIHRLRRSLAIGALVGSLAPWLAACDSAESTFRADSEGDDSDSSGDDDPSGTGDLGSRDDENAEAPRAGLERELRDHEADVDADAAPAVDIHGERWTNGAVTTLLECNDPAFCKNCVTEAKDTCGRVQTYSCTLGSSCTCSYTCKDLPAPVGPTEQ
jgi:hypothetical protein